MEEEVLEPGPPEVNEALFLMAKAFLLAIDEDQTIDVDLLQEICEMIVEKEEFETIELLKEALGENEAV